MRQKRIIYNQHMNHALKAVVLLLEICSQDIRTHQHFKYLDFGRHAFCMHFISKFFTAQQISNKYLFINNITNASINFCHNNKYSNISFTFSTGILQPNAESSSLTIQILGIRYEFYEDNRRRERERDRVYDNSIYFRT